MIDERRIVEAKKAFIADKKILGIIAMNDLACDFKYIMDSCTFADGTPFGVKVKED